MTEERERYNAAEKVEVEFSKQIADAKALYESLSFIHSSLDDAGLKPDEFRVYCHMLRRAGSDYKAWPSYQSIGDVCFSHLKKPESRRSKAIRAIKNLNKIRMLTKKRTEEHDSNTYHITPPSKWVTSDVISPGGDVISLPASDVISPKGTPIQGTPYKEQHSSVAEAPEKSIVPNGTDSAVDGEIVAEETEWQKFLKALSWVCLGHEDWTVLPKESDGSVTQGAFLREAGKIRKSGYTIDDLRTWWTDCWTPRYAWTAKNGQKIKRPSVHEVYKLIPEVRSNAPEGFEVDQKQFESPKYGAMKTRESFDNVEKMLERFNHGKTHGAAEKTVPQLPERHGERRDVGIVPGSPIKIRSRDS